VSWQLAIPPYERETGGRLILLEAKAGERRRRFLEDWKEEQRAAGGAAFHLPCDASFGGPWAGVRELLRELVPPIEAEAPQLLEKHSTELLMVLPTLRPRLTGIHPSLTDVAFAEERVRNYPMDRAYRHVNGLVDLLLAWQEHAGHPFWAIACDAYDRAGALGGRTFRELMRRAGGRLRLTLALAAEPGAFAAPGFPGPEFGRPHEVLKVRPSLPEAAEPAPDPAEMAAKAAALEREFVANPMLQAERMPEVVHYWLHSATPERALPYQGFAFAEYNHLGFYEDAVPYGRVVLPNIDKIVDRTVFNRWNMVGALANCHLALKQPERALEIVEQEALGKIDNSTDMARVYYVLALIHARFLPKPDFATAERYVELGLAELDKEDVSERDRTFLRVFTLNGLAFVRHRQGRPEEALELCQTGFDTLGRQLADSEHKLHRSVLLYNTGQVYSAIGSAEDGIRFYTAAIEMDPNYSEYYNERGNLYLDLRQLDLAVADYHRAIELSGPYWEVWSNLGQASKQMGRMEDAVAAYTRALELDPCQLLPRLGRAQAHELAGRAEAALADYSQALELEPRQPLVLGNRAEILYSQGRLDLALADLDRAIALDPRSPDLYFNRSVALADLGEAERAVADLRTYLELRPDAGDRPEVEERISQLAGGVATIA
jgi:tetratricopeptide (TPR) repeat protein